MKKLMKIILAMVVICMALAGCNSQKEPNEEKFSEPIYEDFPMDEALSEMEGLLEGIELTKLSASEIEDKYHFGTYKDLKMIVASDETDTSISEIAIVRLNDMEQSTDILLKFLDRKEALKEKYAENEKMQEILSAEDSVIIKQQQGIAVMIIGENAKDLEMQFDKNLKQ